MSNSTWDASEGISIKIISSSLRRSQKPVYLKSWSEIKTILYLRFSWISDPLMSVLILTTMLTSVVIIFYKLSDGSKTFRFTWI